MVVGDEPMETDEYEMNLQPLKQIEAAQALSSNDAMVVLDIDITPELAAEGIARDVVRMVQQARKDAGFEVSDRISLHINGNETLQKAVNDFNDYISEQVLATEVLVGAKAENPSYSTSQPIDGDEVVVDINKVANAKGTCMLLIKH